MLSSFFVFFYEDYYSLQKYVRGVVVVYYLTLALELRWPSSIALNVSLLVYQIAFAAWFRVLFWKAILVVLTGVLVASVWTSMGDLKILFLYAALGNRSGVVPSHARLRCVRYKKDSTGRVDSPVFKNGEFMKRMVVCFHYSIALASAPSARTQESRTPDDLKREAASEVDKFQKLTQEMVDSIFSFSELGFQEYETSKYVTGILEKNGFRIERGVAGIPTAWVATYGSGKPVIGFITDIDCIPRASQKPGVAYHDPIIEGAPGHGEGHNSGQAVNVTSAIVLKKLMEKYKMQARSSSIPASPKSSWRQRLSSCAPDLFKDVDIMLGSHVGSEFATYYGHPAINSGLVSVQYSFNGKAAHSAGSPWSGRSALDAVELMNIGGTSGASICGCNNARTTSSSTAVTSRTSCRQKPRSGITSASWNTRGSRKCTNWATRWRKPRR